jgi:hypothetical protein
MEIEMNLQKYYRRLKALSYGLKYPNLLRKAIKDSLNLLYVQGHFQKPLIQQIAYDAFFNQNTEIKLSNFIREDSNVSYLELLVIASIIATKKPFALLEIGTFNGNTTLQMALNSLPESVVHTIDLGKEQITTQFPAWKGWEDLKYIIEDKSHIRKFVGHDINRKIVQHVGDSAKYDFSEFRRNGAISFCFIDAAHSYEYVKNDTEKVLPILRDEAIVVWHDYTPYCEGVYRYLNELGKSLPLKHVSQTTLVIYEKK